MWDLIRPLLEQLDLTFYDDIKTIPAISLTENNLVRLEVFSNHAGGLVKLELDDVRWQQQIKEPVGGDAELAIEAR